MSSTTTTRPRCWPASHWLSPLPRALLLTGCDNTKSKSRRRR